MRNDKVKSWGELDPSQIREEEAGMKENCSALKFAIRVGELKNFNKIKFEGHLSRCLDNGAANVGKSITSKASRTDAVCA